MKEIVLIGGGGHCHSCIDVIEQEGKYKIIGILDKKERIGETVLGYSIIGCDDDLPRYVQSVNTFITIGQIKTATIRKKLYEKIITLGGIFPTIISPRAYISKHSSIGPGTIIMHNAVVNANTKIGCNCIINSQSLIEHDVIIKDHCHISTGSILNGQVIINSESFVGSNATIKEGCEVLNNTTIPAHTFYKTGERQ